MSGREMLNILEERGFPVSEVVALASRRSLGTEVSYGDRTLKVKVLDQYDFSDTDICLMSAGGETSKELVAEDRARRAASSSIIPRPCAMIPDVPLIVPEVNPDAITQFHASATSSPIQTARRRSSSWR